MTVTYDFFQAALESLKPQDSSSLLSHSRLLGFDTETTGVKPGKDAIVSACLVLRDPQRGSEGDMLAQWIINPHRKISPGASRVNGFTNEYLEEHGAEPIEAIKQIAYIIALAQSKHIPLLAYNAPFDIAMLNGDLERWCSPMIPAFNPSQMLVVDPLVMDRAVSKRSGRRSLEYTTEYYGVVPEGNFHDAAADTIAAIDLIKPMTTLYPQLAHLTIDNLMDWQRQAHPQWSDSYRQWAKDHNKQYIAINTHWL